MKNKIIRYEKARQLVSMLSNKRRLLISQCEGLDTSEDNHGMIVGIGKLCTEEAWSFMQSEINDEFGVDYEHILMNEIYDGEGACDNCRKAYNLKHNELANARREFGNAKRSLSYLGKKLIKEVTY